MSKYINADELLKQLNACKYTTEKKTKQQVAYNTAINDVCRNIDAISAADVAEVRHGKWIFETLDGIPGYRPTVMFCSKCSQVSIADYNYCPYCGAKMKAEPVIHCIDYITDEIAKKIIEEANKACSNCQEWVCDECEYRHWRNRG